MRIFAAVQAGLPAQIGTPRSPTVNGEQHGFQIISPYRLRQAQALQYPAICILWGARQCLKRLAQLGQPHQHANAMVVLQCVQPERVQAFGALGLPVSLVLVEVGGAGLAHLVGNGLAPGQPGMAFGVVVQHFDQQRQLSHLGGCVQCLQALCVG